MTWIKRNLWFLIGLLVAVGLMAVGGYYFYTEYQEEGQLATEIRGQYDDLKKLIGRSPNPGKAGAANVDNVGAATNQTAALRALVDRLRAGFQPIRPVETTANFQHQLDSSISALKAEAQQAGVALPTDYHFTFQTESKMVNLPAKTFPDLAGHLSVIQAICGVLFDAKINSLEFVQRPMVAGIETNGQDFLPAAATAAAATPLADLTPYKISFHCFSGELGSVLTGLANSPHGFIVKYIDVDPGSGAQLPAKVPQPARGGRPATFLNENLLGVTLFIEVVQPKPGK